MTIKNKYGEFLAVTRNEVDRLNKDKMFLCERIEDSKKFQADLFECRDVMNIVGTLAQQKIRETVEQLVTEALQAVFGFEYSFVMETKVVRNKPEVYMSICYLGQLYSMKDELGGGIVDLVSFVLRVVFWAINTPRSADMIVLDEPGKFISKDLQPMFGEMIKELHNLLGLQFVIISHEEMLIDTADTSYSVALNKGVSNVGRIK